MRKFKETLIDDLDGTEAQNVLPFSVSGVDYEIDLSDRNYARFFEYIGPYMEAARQLPRRQARRRRETTVWVDPTLVRAWAKQHGVSVPGRGIIPESATREFLRWWLDNTN